MSTITSGMLSTYWYSVHRYQKFSSSVNINSDYMSKLKKSSVIQYGLWIQYGEQKKHKSDSCMFARSKISLHGRGSGVEQFNPTLQYARKSCPLIAGASYVLHGYKNADRAP
nr:PREDICTED: uncharacterized protein LOC105668199 [Linepithema humile]